MPKKGANLGASSDSAMVAPHSWRWNTGTGLVGQRTRSIERGRGALGRYEISSIARGLDWKYCRLVCEVSFVWGTEVRLFA